MKKLRVLEFFSGIGATHVAFEMLKEQLDVDFEFVDAIEIDPYPMKMYNAMFGTDHPTQDVTKWNKTIEELGGEIDIIQHSSPCQSFSNQGKGAGGAQGSGTPSSLLWEMVRICKSIRPKIMIWENVLGLLNHKHQEVYEEYKEELRLAGYISYTVTMNASDYGAPQMRPRVFTISVRRDFSDEIFFTPSVFYNRIYFKDILEDSAADFPFHWYELNGKTFLKESEDNYFKNVKLEKELYFKSINSEYEYISPRIYVLAELDIPFKSASRIFSTDGIAPTLDTKSEVKIGIKEDLTEPNAFRYITPLESWRLNGFPDEYYFKASKAVHSSTRLKKAAGNSITTAQMYHLIKDILIRYFGEDYYNKDRLSDSIYYLPYFEGKGIYKDNA